jgi:ribonucleoside-triphosphate reductase
MPLRLNPRWKTLLTVMGLCCAAAAPVAFLVPSSRPLILLFLYTIPSHSVVPLPHEPAMVLAGKMYDPLIVALVAGVATFISSFLDYETVNLIFSRTRVGDAREHRVYQGCVTYFLKAPFVSLVLAAFTPFIVFYPFRILSPTSGYPVRRYMLAVFIGRVPRFYLEALLGHALNWTNTFIVGGGVLLACWAILARVTRHLERRGGRVEEGEAQSARCKVQNEK